MQETNKQLSEAIFEQVARIGKAVSNPKRLEILELLSQAPRTVEALAQAAQAEPSQYVAASSDITELAAGRSKTRRDLDLVSPYGRNGCRFFPDAPGSSRHTSG